MKILLIFFSIVSLGYYRPLDAPWAEWIPDTIPSFQNDISLVDYGTANYMMMNQKTSRNLKEEYDAELNYLSIRYGKQKKRWFYGSSVRLAYISGGIYDGAIENYHSFIGFPNNDRHSVPRHRRKIEIDYSEDSKFVSEKNSFRPVHPEIWAGFQTNKYSNIALHVKFPTSKYGTWHSTGYPGAALVGRVGYQFFDCIDLFASPMAGYWGKVRGYSGNVNDFFIGGILSAIYSGNFAEVGIHFDYFSKRFFGYKTILDKEMSEIKLDFAHTYKDGKKIFFLFTEEYASFMHPFCGDSCRGGPDFSANLGVQL